MKKLALLCLSICTFGAASVASAENVYIAGNSGILDNTQGNCGLPILPEAKMQVSGSSCVIDYPISLPAGKTIDTIFVAYKFALPGAPSPSIVAYLAENRVDAGLGSVAVAGTNVKNITAFGPGFLNMPFISIPILDGNVNWVQIHSNFVDVQYVEIAYH